MKIRKLSTKEWIVWGLLYILFVSHGTYILNFSQIETILPFTLIVVVLYFKFGCQLTTELFVLFSLLLANHIITGILSGAGMSEGFNFSGFLGMISVVLSVILLYKLDNDVMTKFIKMLYFFSCISLVGYLIASSGFGNVLTSLFSTYNTGMGVASGKIFYVYYLGKTNRNVGIFTEPGIYQAVLVICIYVILFLGDRISLTKKQSSRYLVVFLITLITTKSAAGYIGLFAIVIGVLLKKKEKRDYFIVGILSASVAFLIYDYYTLGNDSILQQYFFGKLIETQQESINLTSGGARLVAMQMGWEAAITHPFGIGYLNWENQLYQIYGRKFGTGNALFTQLGTRGFIAFFISLYLAIGPALKRKKGWLEFTLYVFLFVYIATAQAKILYPAIVLTAYLPRRELQTNE